MASTSGLAEGERVVLRVHQHWKVIFWSLVVLALIIAAVLVIALLVPGIGALGRLILAAAAIVAAFIFVLGPVLRWWTTAYELTNRRLRLRAGVLTRRGRDFPLSRISDVSFSQGLLDRVLGCGRLIVESPGEHGQLVLTEIPQVQQVQALLFQLVEDEQARLSREQQ
jgi:uncharacterized membrane protein YdbT with pleckstrin-like domain